MAPISGIDFLSIRHDLNEHSVSLRFWKPNSKDVQEFNPLELLYEKQIYFSDTHRKLILVGDEDNDIEDTYHPITSNFLPVMHGFITHDKLILFASDSVFRLSAKITKPGEAVELETIDTDVMFKCNGLSFGENLIALSVDVSCRTLSPDCPPNLIPLTEIESFNTDG